MNVKKVTDKIPPKPTVEKELLHYWRNFDVNIDAIVKNWEIEVRDQIDHLKKYQPNHFEEIGNILNLNGSPIEIKDKIVKDSNLLLKFILSSYFLNLNRIAVGRALAASKKEDKFYEILTIIKIISHIQLNTLDRIYMEYLKVKLGKGDYNYNFKSKPKPQNIKLLNEKIKSIAQALSFSSSDGKSYNLRFCIIDDDFAHVLVLRQTADEIIPAIPNNKRVQKAKYILSVVNFKQKKVSITTGSRREAAVIKGFFGRKLGISIGFDLNEFEVDFKSFFEKLLNIEESKESGIILNGIKVRESVGNVKGTFEGAETPDKIIKNLQVLKDRAIIQFRNINEFQSFKFQHKNLDYTIRVAGNKWGQRWLQLNSTSKPTKEMNEFQKSFEKHFKIEFNKAIGGSMGEKGIAQAILDHSRIEASLPRKIESVFLQLVNLNILEKPKHSTKRKCLSCGKINWAKDSCPSCGGELMLLGLYVEIIHNYRSLTKYFKDFLKSNLTETLQIRTKKIIGKKHEFLVISEKNRTPVWFYICTGGAISYLKDVFERNGQPLIIVYSKHGKNNPENILSDSCRKFDFLDFVYDPSPDTLSTTIQDLRDRSKSLRHNAAVNSAIRLQAKPKGYDDQHFEQDVFNILNELTKHAEMLGGSFSGTAAPDGVASVTLAGANPKKHTLAWDCKFSVRATGYELNEDPNKHLHYLKSLSRNKNFKQFGNLRTYLFISQNMNFKSYKRFIEKFNSSKKWRNGKVIFLNESELLEIFKIYIIFHEQIDRDSSHFFLEFWNLFKNSKKTKNSEYIAISNDSLKTFESSLRNSYPMSKKTFELSRSDFKKKKK